MLGLSAYFEKKIGQKITRRIIKETKRVPYDLFGRVYKAEVLYTDPELASVVVHVSSHDIFPNNATRGGPDRDLGDLKIDVCEMFGLDDFWTKVLTELGTEDTVMALYLRSGRPER